MEPKGYEDVSAFFGPDPPKAKPIKIDPVAYKEWMRQNKPTKPRKSRTKGSSSSSSGSHSGGSRASARAVGDESVAGLSSEFLGGLSLGAPARRRSRGTVSEADWSFEVLHTEPPHVSPNVSAVTMGDFSYLQMDDSTDEVNDLTLDSPPTVPAVPVRSPAAPLPKPSTPMDRQSSWLETLSLQGLEEDWGQAPVPPPERPKTTPPPPRAAESRVTAPLFPRQPPQPPPVVRPPSQPLLYTKSLRYPELEGAEHFSVNPLDHTAQPSIAPSKADEAAMPEVTVYIVFPPKDDSQCNDASDASASEDSTGGPRASTLVFNVPIGEDGEPIVSGDFIRKVSRVLSSTREAGARKREELEREGLLRCSSVCIRPLSSISNHSGTSSGRASANLDDAKTGKAVSKPNRPYIPPEVASAIAATEAANKGRSRTLVATRMPPPPPPQPVAPSPPPPPQQPHQQQQPPSREAPQPQAPPSSSRPRSEHSTVPTTAAKKTLAWARKPLTLDNEEDAGPLIRDIPRPPRQDVPPQMEQLHPLAMTRRAVSAPPTAPPACPPVMKPSTTREPKSAVHRVLYPPVRTKSPTPISVVVVPPPPSPQPPLLSAPLSPSRAKAPSPVETIEVRRGPRAVPSALLVTPHPVPAPAAATSKQATTPPTPDAKGLREVPGLPATLPRFTWNTRNPPGTVLEYDCARELRKRAKWVQNRLRLRD